MMLAPQTIYDLIMKHHHHQVQQVMLVWAGHKQKIKEANFSSNKRFAVISHVLM